MEVATMILDTRCARVCGRDGATYVSQSAHVGTARDQEYGHIDALLLARSVEWRPLFLWCSRPGSARARAYEARAQPATYVVPGVDRGSSFEEELGYGDYTTGGGVVQGRSMKLTRCMDAWSRDMRWMDGRRIELERAREESDASRVPARVRWGWPGSSTRP